MKDYPSISGRYEIGKRIIAFQKHDGSQIRSDWSVKRGFYKFGTRTQLMDEKTPIFGEAIGLIRTKYEKSLSDIFNKLHWKRATAFFEFFGPNSIAGWHDKEQHDVILIDIAFETRGLIEPDKFCEIFDNVDIAKVLYKGEITEEFVDSVRTSSLKGIGLEGIVAKGKYISPGQPYMCKIKTHKWLDLLKERCNGDIGLFEKLK